MLARGAITTATECRFIHLHKGQYEYELTADGKTFFIRGGRATWEAAYYLELHGVEKLGTLLDDIDQSDD